MKPHITEVKFTKDGAVYEAMVTYKDAYINVFIDEAIPIDYSPINMVSDSGLKVEELDYVLDYLSEFLDNLAVKEFVASKD